MSEGKEQLDVDQAISDFQSEVTTSINETGLPMSVINLVLKQVVVETERIVSEQRIRKQDNE